MATGYIELLRMPHASRLITATLVGRLPYATAPLAIVIFARSEGASYTLAGALAALYGLATAVGQPWLGRLADVHGQPRVMLPSAVVSAVAMIALAAVAVDPVLPAALAIVVAGVATPPLEGGLRALWPSVLKRQDRVHRAYALDAVAQEVMFAVGPLVVMVLVAAWSPAGALLVVNVLGVLGALAVVTSVPSRDWRSEPREAHWLGALRSSGMLVLLGAFLFVGISLGSISVAAVAYAENAGDELISTYLLSALGAGALVGGLWYGARTWTGEPERRLVVLVAALAAGYLPLVLAPESVLAMTLLAGASGLFLAPVLACAFVVIDRHAPTGTVTEAFSWLVTVFGVGVAGGTAVVGPILEEVGVAAGFGVAGVGGIAALLVLLSTRRVLAARPVRAGEVAVSPAAAAVEPVPGSGTAGK
ncbi:MFS transporter [Streptomyces bohaiensis]|uniref:MFS transporter n=1 Tax=Streptomyces bohaiensis TaxID=1431344 RepID=A0ABX1C9D5_9ACTN|nr:MFS transporter [Streptomyces bohaiensis]NJQ14673.1 MFS transporter [Streptomyces bohaiensis]